MIHQAFVILFVAAVLVPLVVLAAQGGAGETGGRDASRVQPIRRPDKEIVYKKILQGGGELKFFVYLPAGWKAADKRAAILFFFGGGWRVGSPTQFFSKAEYFASRGMVAISAEYRISSVHQTGVKECVFDARSAMRFLRTHAGEWGVDPEKIVASGGSAGGHLAAALVLPGGKETDDPADDAAVSCRPRAMVLFNPVMDLMAAFDDAKTTDVMRKSAPGNSDEEKKQFLRVYSPIEHLGKNLPPTLMLYGEQDPFLSHAHAYADKSISLGNKVELWTAANIGHGFFNGQPWHNATLIKTDKFLAELGILQGPPTIKN
ncbi:MAG: alpha/beta hydrolase [Phycisphaerales bacterium]|nr:alpha/beta hydrolase [Phycisphaerales bacterium]